MLNANLLKFSQNKQLMIELLRTGNKIIVEASSSDKIWGIGLSEKKAKEIDPDEWPGQNLLGKVLVEVREKIKNVLSKCKDELNEKQNKNSINKENTK